MNHVDQFDAQPRLQVGEISPWGSVSLAPDLRSSIDGAAWLRRDTRQGLPRPPCPPRSEQRSSPRVTPRYTPGARLPRPAILRGQPPKWPTSLHRRTPSRRRMSWKSDVLSGELQSLADRLDSLFAKWMEANAVGNVEQAGHLMRVIEEIEQRGDGGGDVARGDRAIRARGGPSRQHLKICATRFRGPAGDLRAMDRLSTGLTRVGDGLVEFGVDHTWDRFEAMAVAEVARHDRSPLQVIASPRGRTRRTRPAPRFEAGSAGAATRPFSEVRLRDGRTARD